MLEAIKTSDYAGDNSSVAACHKWGDEADHESKYAKIIQLVGNNKRVLELGCGAGGLTRCLQENGCQVVGVEIEQTLADQASSYCESVLVADLDRLDPDAVFGEERFDVIVAAQVLECLKDPWDLLRVLKNRLRPGGYLVAAVSNVAYGISRLAPLEGRLPFRTFSQGDGSRRRFFTHDAIVCLFEEAGYAIGHLERQEAPLENADAGAREMPASVLNRLAEDPDATTSQFIVAAYPLPQEGIQWLQRHVRELAEEKEAATRELVELHQKLAEQELTTARKLAELRQTRLEAVSKRETELRADLLDVHDQLIRRDLEFQRSVAELTAQCDWLTGERKALTVERDHLLWERSQVIADRDRLANEHAAVVAQRAALEHRIERFRRTLPGLVYRGLRKMVNVLRRRKG